MQPTARSTPASSSSAGTTPAEWLRSQRTSAPAACATSVIARTSASAPERYATCERQTSDTRARRTRARRRRPSARRSRRSRRARARRGPRARSGRSGSWRRRSRARPRSTRAPPPRACRGSPSWSRRRAPRLRSRRARRRRADRRLDAGRSIHSGQAVTSRDPHSSTTLRSSLDRALREPAERVAVRVDRPLVLDHEPLAE